MYRHGEWEQVTSRFPDVVYNTSGFSNGNQCKAVDELQQHGVPFTSFSIGDKITVYRNLIEHREFANYLVPTEIVSSARHINSFIEKYNNIVLKPTSGSQGRNIFHIKADSEIPDEAIKMISEQECIIQPYINCRTKSGEPYDLRLHVQKVRGGEWAVPSVYPRISPDGEVVCNISRGGYTRDLDDFLKIEFGVKSDDMDKYLRVFALQFARHMDEIQKKLYNEELDELGIDVGWDKQLYIYEVNWRPGHPPFLNVDLSVIRNTVHYAMYLAEKEGL
jgi:UDP-N-acetylmuramoyl-tripeptide--D-alanyl-D-alanine ligase